jgi:hypothetical protein
VVRTTIAESEERRGAALSPDGWWKTSNLDKPWHMYSEKDVAHVDYNHDGFADLKRVFGARPSPSILFSGKWVRVGDFKGDPRKGCRDLDGNWYEFQDATWRLKNEDGAK